MKTAAGRTLHIPFSEDGEGELGPTGSLHILDTAERAFIVIEFEPLVDAENQGKQPSSLEELWFIVLHSNGKSMDES